MTKKFAELEAQMSPAVRERVAKRVEETLKAMERGEIWGTEEMDWRPVPHVVEGERFRALK